MTECYRIIDQHALDDLAAGPPPVLVMHFEGWIDAGYSAAAAVHQLTEALDRHTVVDFDSDMLLDYRARRPVLRLVDGKHRAMTWPGIRLEVAHLASGQPLMLLTGHEPDFRWHAFADAVVDIASEAGVRLAVGFGAFPAPVPHTRTVGVATSSSGDEPLTTLGSGIGYVPGDVEVPAGVEAVLEQHFEMHGITAVGLWARVPHYVAGSNYPAASLALLEAFGTLAGSQVDVGSLPDEARMARLHLDHLLENSEEHTEMVRQLEESIDSDGDEVGPRIVDGPLPSGDEIAAELERFLRDQ